MIPNVLQNLQGKWRGARTGGAYPLKCFIKNNGTSHRDSGLVRSEILINVINVCYVRSQG